MIEGEYVENSVEESQTEEIIVDGFVEESDTGETVAVEAVEKTVEIVPVFDQEEFFGRLTVWASEAMPQQAAPVDPLEVADAVVSALDEREAQQAQLMEGEILLPGSEDIAVIKQVVQNILSFFQEDDHDVLSDIREDVAGIREYVESQQQIESHPMMTTNFADYTVTEGLLLLILLLFVIEMCVRMVKGGFSWLL